MNRNSTTPLVRRVRNQQIVVSCNKTPTQVAANRRRNQRRRDKRRAQAQIMAQQQQQIPMLPKPQRQRRVRKVMGQVVGSSSTGVPVTADNNLSTGANPIERLANSMNAMSMVPTDAKSKFSSPVGDMRYIHCRLDPFSSTGSLGIPDNSNVRKIVVDYRTYFDISYTNSNYNTWLLLTPTLPCMTYIKTDTGTSLTYTGSIGTGTVAANNIFTFPTPQDSLNYAWLAADIPTEWLTYAATSPYSATANLYKGVPDPYGATNARLVTRATKIYYTGQASLAGGTLMVQEAPWAIVSGEKTLNAGLLNDGGASAPSSNTNAGLANVAPGRFTNNIGTLTRNAYNTRTELGAYILQRHKSEVSGTDGGYRWREMQRQPINFVGDTAVVPSPTVAGSAVFRSVNYGTQYFGTMAWYDEDWTPLIVNLQNQVAGNSYRVETVFCIEFTIAQNSPFERLSVENKRDPVQLKAIDMITNQVPIAHPVAAPKTYLDRAIDVAGSIAAGVAPIVKMFL